MGFFVVPYGTSYFPLGPPLRGKFALTGLIVAHTLVWTFSFVVPGGTSYFEAWWAVYFTAMPPPLILAEGVARKFLSHNRLVNFRVNVLQTLKLTNYLIINLLRITHNVSSLKWLNCRSHFRVGFTGYCLEMFSRMSVSAWMFFIL